MTTRHDTAPNPWQTIIWLMLNITDASLTFFALQHGLTEANPLLACLPGPELILVKFALAVGVLWGLQRFRRTHLLLPLNVLMGLVVVWNIAIMGVT